MKNAKPGTSLFEIVIAIAITGLLAMVSLPKFVNSQQDYADKTVGEIDQLQQAIVTALENYQAASGKSIDMLQPSDIDAYGGVIGSANEYDNNWQYTTYEKIFYNYGNFMGYRSMFRWKRYFIMPNQSIVTFNASLFGLDPLYQHDSGSTEYAWAGVTWPGKALQGHWGGGWTGGPGANTWFCGDYRADECLYVDINGTRYGANRVGPFGDIIPFRIDPVTLQIKTLYQWHYEEWRGPAICAGTGLGACTGYMNDYNVCRFVSFYDVVKDAPGAADCLDSG